MYGQYGEPSREEWAIYIALTLFAVHQQSEDPKEHCVSRRGISLGRAAAQMVAADLAEEGGAAAQEKTDKARERVARRFHQVVLAPDMMSMAYYLRGFIQLLRARDIALDYPMLARDLYQYQFQEQRASVRLNWGQDFYRMNQVNAEKGKDENQ